MALLEGGKSTKVQVPFLSNVLYSTFITISQVGFERTKLVVLGSRSVRSNVRLILGSTIPYLARVQIKCALSGLTREGCKGSLE